MSAEAKNTTATIIPTLRYRDAARAVQWLCQAFGFRERFVVRDDDGGIAHAQLVFGNGMVMLGTARDDEFGALQSPLKSPDDPVCQSPYIIDEDVDAHHDRAVEAGARVTLPPTDQDYGGRLYSARDFEGNLWNFGSYDPWDAES